MDRLVVRGVLVAPLKFIAILPIWNYSREKHASQCGIAYAEITLYIGETIYVTMVKALFPLH